MPVKNVVLKSIEARRYQDQPQGPVKLRIDHNSHLSLVEAAGDGQVRIDFEFTTSYGAFGVIKMEGRLVADAEDADSVASKWQETRNLPPELAQQVHSGILSACVPDAVGLAKNVRLPPPIPMPQVRIGQGADAQAKGKAPSDSPEIG